MKRQSRLQSAQYWVKTYNGKNIINGYKKWFGVDLVCAIKELRILDVNLDEQYIERALKGLEDMIAARKKDCERKSIEELFESWCNSDDNGSVH